MLSQKIIIPALVVALAGGGLAGMGMVHAQDSNSVPSLVQMIAQRFNLNQADVQAVFDAHRHQMEDRRLSNLVSQGKITNDQKTAIENELSALKGKYLNNLSNLTPDQRRQAKQNFRNDFQAWLKLQNIDPTIFMLGFGRGQHKMWMTPKPSASP